MPVNRVETVGKVYRVEGAGNGGTALTSNTTPIDFTETYDPDGLWDGDEFTAPVSGIYQVTGAILTTASHSSRIEYYIDDVKQKNWSDADLASTVEHFSGQVYLEKDEVLELRLTGSLTLSNSTQLHHIIITSVPDKNKSIAVTGSNPDTEWATTSGVTVNGVTSDPSGTRGNDSQVWRRDGEHLEVRVTMNITASGGAGSGDYLWKLPSVCGSDGATQCEIDTTKFIGGNASADNISGSVVGYGSASTTASEGTNYDSAVRVTIYDADQVRLLAESASALQGWNVGSGTFQFSDNPAFTFFYRVPIVGWSQATNVNYMLPTIDYDVTNTFSATISSTGTVSNENLDWINGNCTNANPMVCTFNSGHFTGNPNCTVSDASTSNGIMCEFNGQPDSTSADIKCYNDGGTIFTTSVAKNLICQNGASDFKSQGSVAHIISQPELIVDTHATQNYVNISASTSYTDATFVGTIADDGTGITNGCAYVHLRIYDETNSAALFESGEVTYSVGTDSVAFKTVYYQHTFGADTSISFDVKCSVASGTMYFSDFKVKRKR
jgi:hypothetical protein